MRAQPDASLLRVRDIGRVELGAQTYSGFSRLNGKPSANVIVYLAPGANAVETADQVITFMEQREDELSRRASTTSCRTTPPCSSAPPSRTCCVTLLEAIGLVILVVFIFLQNWRATLIPLLTVPVAVVGTFALFPAARLLDQHHQHVRPGAGDRHRGGRRHRGGGGGAAPYRRRHESRATPPCRRCRKCRRRWSRSRSFWRRCSSRWLSSAASAARSTSSSR